jgi:hypothetical protein
MFSAAPELRAARAALGSTSRANSSSATRGKTPQRQRNAFAQLRRGIASAGDDHANVAREPRLILERSSVERHGMHPALPCSVQLGERET